MYLKLKAESRIVGIDYLDNPDKEVTIFTRDKKSIIIHSSFIDIFSMLCGAFTECDVESYINTRFKKNSSDIIKWINNICSDELHQSLWKSNINSFSVNDFNIRNLYACGNSIKLLDSVITLAKLPFQYIYVDSNSTIEKSMISDSIYLNDSHIGKTFADVIKEYHHNAIPCEFLSNDNMSDNDIILLDDRTVINSNSTNIFAIKDYERISDLCDSGLFAFCSDNNNASLMNYITAFNIQNDVLLSLFNGNVD